MGIGVGEKGRRGWWALTSILRYYRTVLMHVAPYMMDIEH